MNECEHKAKQHTRIRIPELWNRWLDLLYGAAKCPNGKRVGAHDWFYANCDGCRADWIRQMRNDDEKAAADARERRIAEWVEALRRFSAAGSPPPASDHKRGL